MSFFLPYWSWLHVWYILSECTLPLIAAFPCLGLSNSGKNSSCSGDSLKRVLKAAATAAGSCASHVSLCLPVIGPVTESSAWCTDCVDCYSPCIAIHHTELVENTISQTFKHQNNHTVMKIQLWKRWLKKNQPIIKMLKDYVIFSWMISATLDVALSGCSQPIVFQL